METQSVLLFGKNWCDKFGLVILRFLLNLFSPGSPLIMDLKKDSQEFMAPGVVFLNVSAILRLVSWLFEQTNLK